MPGPYRDDLEAVRARVREEERANGRRGGWRARVLGQPQLIVAVVVLAFGGLTTWLRGHDSGPNFVFGRPPLDRHELHEPLRRAEKAAVEQCSFPKGAYVDVELSVQYGKPTSASVRTVPWDETRGACILDQIGKIGWPSTPSTQTTRVRWTRD